MASSGINEKLLDEARVYESVLSNMPHDEFALSRLVEIYAKCENSVKLQEFKQRLAQAQNGELDLSNFGDLDTHKQKNNFFKNHSKIHDLISSCNQKDNHFFNSRMAQWTDVRPHIALLIRLRESGLIDTNAYIDICLHLMRSRNQPKQSVWKGVVSHFPDCDRVNYSELLDALKSQSGMEYVDLSEFHYSNELEVLPKKLISHCELLIFSITKSEVSVAMLNPFNEVVKDLLRDYFTLPVKFYLTDVQSFNTFAKGS